jgi:hypothetical protein
VVNAAPGRQLPPRPAAQQPLAHEELSAAAPSFSSFPAAPASNPALAPAFLSVQAPAARPALTFQDENFAAAAARPAAVVPPLATPTTLPKSALEIVDFNQLLQEFQGSQQPGRSAIPHRFQGEEQQQQLNQFPVQQQQQVLPAFQQARFSNNNFPVRF